MDYLLACLLLHVSSCLSMIVSYDIACQWSVHLYHRLLGLPQHVRTELDLALFIFVIPKLHILGHELSCQVEYSLNLTPGVGRSDGKGIERPWAHLGPVATSTHEMGPGSRHDTLDDHLGNWNWGKLVGFGKLWRKRLLEAYKGLALQRGALEAFSEAQSEYVDLWLQQIKDWEADRSKPNPYVLPQSGLTFAYSWHWRRLNKI